MIRITCDIDSNSRIIALYYLIKGFFIIKDLKAVVIKRSHSNNFHLIFWTEYNYKEKEQYSLRRRLGDDTYRLSRDIIRDFGKNTLFDKKYKYDEFFLGNEKEL